MSDKLINTLKAPKNYKLKIKSNIIHIILVVHLTPKTMIFTDMEKRKICFL